ncbi:hypothetical protein TrCOL_g2743 [Triparma columacea]|uniref:Uncharacterized protein n=1 Tax=Triparma columacea TaxID=722753 RepID=A0A9W7GBN7_9STRA|nr:hypothetical protein TrCOL_g2743 [Triparma columacea]
MKFASISTLLISSSFASLAGAQTADCMTASTADTYKAFSGMCDSNSCDYKYSTSMMCIALLFLVDMEDTPTMEMVDACCTDNGVAAACDGVTTYMNLPCEGGVCPFDAIDASCAGFEASLDGGGATTAISGLAMAAAGAAILNNVL